MQGWREQISEGVYKSIYLEFIIIKKIFCICDALKSLPTPKILSETLQLAETSEPYKNKLRGVNSTLQPAQLSQQHKNNVSHLREGKRLMSSPCCVVVGEKEPEVWMVYLSVTKPIIRLLHERGCKLLLLVSIRGPNRAPQFVWCQSKDRQC
jgi:hypothetical protein